MRHKEGKHVPNAVKAGLAEAPLGKFQVLSANLADLVALFGGIGLDVPGFDQVLTVLGVKRVLRPELALYQSESLVEELLGLLDFLFGQVCFGENRKTLRAVEVA